jgi:hypothetical protein
VSETIETPAGLIAWECEAEPKHIGFVEAPENEDEIVFNPCMVCEAEWMWKRIREYDAAEEKRQHRRHPWAQWRLTRKVYGWAYQLGVISSYGTTWSSAHHGCTHGARFRGKRPYILGWERWKWTCVFKGHHWPGEYIAFDCCGKCLPCPSCDSITNAHTDDCDLM